MMRISIPSPQTAHRSDSDEEGIAASPATGVSGDAATRRPPVHAQSEPAQGATSLPNQPRRAGEEEFIAPQARGDSAGPNRHLARVARALYAKKNILICTHAGRRNKRGEYVGTGGTIKAAVVLGEAARRSGSRVAYAVDDHAAPIIRQSLRTVYPAQLARDREANLHFFNTAGTRDASGGAKRNPALSLVADADAVVAFALPNPRATRGDDAVDVGADRAVRDLVDVANRHDVLTIAIVDQAKPGLGSTTLQVTTEEPGFETACIGSMLMKLRGGLKNAIQPSEFGQLMALHSTTEATAGVGQERTVAPGGSTAATTHHDTDAAMDENKKVLARAIKFAEQSPSVRTTEDAPTEIAIFDSSNGAFIAGKVLKAQLDKLGHRTNFIFTVDHGNAPYGQYTGEKANQLNSEGEPESVLHRLVSNGLINAQENGAALIGMACNTACIVPTAQASVDIPVVDLIRVTATAIAEHADANPVLISTPATSSSDAYPEAVLQASSGKINLKKSPVPASSPSYGATRFQNMIAAPRWASAINQLDHLDPTKSAEVKAMVKEIVDQVPHDATSVWLTCTHYPVLQDEIKSALAARGMSIDVINPMPYQADAIAVKIDELEAVDHPSLGHNRMHNQDKVISSGTPEERASIAQSVKAMYGETAVELANFGQTREQTMEAIQRYALRDGLPKNA